MSNCGASTQDGECELPAGGGTDHVNEGRCRYHGGATEDAGPPENNDNASKHELYANRNKLYERLDGENQKEVDKIECDLIERYERTHGREPDYAACKNIFRTAIDIVKQDLADDWLAEKAEESGNPLMEKREMETGGRVIEYHVPNSVHEVTGRLQQETRLRLKQMGLFNDPETQQAESMEPIAQILSEQE
jgi:hypothetical protein